MRTNVSFRYPAEFVPSADYDGVLAADGAEWFSKLLKRVPGLDVEDELCQEDWGVVVFAQRNQKSFWIGLSPWDEERWLAHFHHGSFAWLQRFSSSGKRELRRLVADMHLVLLNEPYVSDITWYEDREMTKASPTGQTGPTDI